MNLNMIESSVKRLFPGISPEHAVAEMLLERAQKNLIKYQLMARKFESKYRENFEAFRERILNSKPEFEMEQDYFDWEMATTGVSDMVEEINRLKNYERS